MSCDVKWSVCDEELRVKVKVRVGNGIGQQWWEWWFCIGPWNVLYGIEAC